MSARGTTTLERIRRTRAGRSRNGIVPLRFARIAPAADATAIAFAVAIGIALASAGAHAQDFTGPAPAGPSASPLAVLDRGLPAPRSGAEAEIASTRWFGLASLQTHALALGAGWRALEIAAGVSRTGDPELGWSAAGFAAGGSGAAGGAAARVVARRDLVPLEAGGALGPGTGLEAGGGAFVRVASGLEVWASSPQLWTRGSAPPLVRGLEVGAAMELEGGRAWAAHRAPTASGFGAGERVLGLALGGAPARVWIEARDRPWRGGVGGSLRAARLAVSVVVEGHPVLGETVMVALTVGTGSAAP